MGACRFIQYNSKQRDSYNFSMLTMICFAAYLQVVLEQANSSIPTAMISIGNTSCDMYVSIFDMYNHKSQKQNNC